MFSLVFERRFSMAHRLMYSASPQCMTPHGHNEYIRVTVEAKKPVMLDQKENMVAEFSAVKKKWHQFIDEKIDHALQLNTEDHELRALASKQKWKVVLTPGDPTTEMMAACLKAKFEAFLEKDFPNLFCAKVELEETPTNKVIFSGNTKEVISSQGSEWFYQDDFSTDILFR